MVIGKPSLILRSAYSTTTIAPSTRRPTERIKAKRTTMLIVKPIKDNASTPDRKAPGIDIPTRMPERIPRAPKIIIKTRIIAAMTLFCKLLSIFLIYLDES